MAVKDNALLMRVFYEHKVVAVVLLSQMQRLRLKKVLDEAEWQVMSMTISHLLKPWQIAVLESYLPQTGAVVGWVTDDSHTLETRLVNVLRKVLKQHRDVVTLADAGHGWMVNVAPLALDLDSVAYQAGAYWEDGVVKGINDPKPGDED